MGAGPGSRLPLAPNIVPPGLFQHLSKDTPSGLFGLRLHKCRCLLLTWCVSVCVSPLFLVIFVSGKDGWGAFPWTWSSPASPGCPQRERFPGSK